MIVIFIKRWLKTLSEKGPDLLKECNTFLSTGAGFFFIILLISQDAQFWSAIDYNPLYLQKGEKKRKNKNKRKEALGCVVEIGQVQILPITKKNKNLRTSKNYMLGFRF